MAIANTVPAASLGELLLRSASPEVAGHLPELEALSRELGSMLDAGQRAYPQIAIDAPTFLEHLARRLPARDPASALAAIHAADLWLACGCALSMPAALCAFDERVLRRVVPGLTRVCGSREAAEEVAQRLRHKLLVRNGAAPPRIAEYAGRGPLTHWVRAAAVRLALDLKATTREALPVDDELSARLFRADADPELAAIRSQHGAAFKLAFGDAVRALSSRDRAVLRMHVLESLTFEQIAAFYRVNKSTVSRWLALARHELLEGTEAHLVRSLKLRRSELDSLVRGLHSRLDCSIGMFLKSSRH